MPTPVTIIGGFLGAGKTTLLDRLLRDARGVRYGVLVNDFAALNIDAEFVREAAPDRIALTNGCVCCTISDDLLASALQLLWSEPRPEHLLIECSGVSDPRSVARALTGELAGGQFVVQALICLVDAANVLGLDYETTEQVIDQAAASDLVLINKCDLAACAEIEQIEQILHEAHPMMRIVRTDREHLSLELITGELAFPSTIPKVRNADASSQATSHAQHFVSRAWRSAQPLSLEAFKQAVKLLPASVYRAKGILQFMDYPDQHGIFQLVGSRSEISLVSGDLPVSESVVVAIGRASAFDAAPFDRLFPNKPRRPANQHLNFTV